MQCMSCPNEGYMIPLTATAKVCLCLECADVARRTIGIRLFTLRDIERYEQRKLDVNV